MKKRIWIVAVLCLVFSTLFLNRQGTARLAYVTQKENFQNAAQQILEQEDAEGVRRPQGVRDVSYCSRNTPVVEFELGGWGMGSATSYWGVRYVPSGELVGTQGSCMDGCRTQGKGTLFYEAEGDNTCYVEPLGGNWYYYEERF